MTTEERQMLQGLADRINDTELANKDADAEQLVQQMLGRNPDALYIMAQTVLVQGYALEQAQKQIGDLRLQVGRHDGPQPAEPAAPAPSPSAGHGMGLAYPSGGYPIAGEPEEGGGFLRSAMQTASGVTTGAPATDRIEGLMHGFGHAAGYGTEFGAAGSGGERRAQIVNKSSGDPLRREHGVAMGRTDQSDDSGDADELSGTEGTDYSSQGDDSMLSDDVGGDPGSGG